MVGFRVRSSTRHGRSEGLVALELVSSPALRGRTRRTPEETQTQDDRTAVLSR